MIDNAEAYREYCLSLGNVEEKMPFGKFAPRYETVLALYVEGHMFTYADVADFGTLNIKVSPDVADELRARYCAVEPPMNLSPRHWVGVRLGEDMDDTTVCKLLRDAYRIVREQYTKKPRRKRP